MNSRRDISAEILEYLREHPDASDTLEGIAEWWLMSQRIRYEMKRVKAAISNLIEKGWVVEVRGKGVRTRYRLHPARQAAVKPGPPTQRGQ